ncbi:alpha/beta fold hydrolase [Flavivirga spongiicola]|uniref:Alpha/beta hydrolase n=1 Tax=Flavivirga spongiicola TaxID=421621 RepID=A0ABU7Y084_9FLAO|nr:alpha/beta fold hydrolase [Flavivirga sp. MEBiC05379]MDO5981110.1 alpha/beta fold hydrolase [Flavivirga sp. MEBiC05379]
MKLYEEKLEGLDIEYTEIDIDTQFGRTRIIKTGNPKGKKVVLFHGYNAGAPVTLEAVKELRNIYCFYAIDTIGQATKSAETKMNIKDDSFAIWSDEVLEKLNINKGNIIGISYGAFIVQKLITYRPQRVKKCVFVVPSGIVNGNIWESMTKLTIPLIRFKITKKERHLKAFLNAFVPEGDKFMFKMLKLIMEGVKLDTRIPALLKRKHIKHFNKPVYIMSASNDIYFPSKKIAKKSKSLFNNLKEVYLLENSKHMPSKNTFGEIQFKIKEWIN